MGFSSGKGYSSSNTCACINTYTMTVAELLKYRLYNQQITHQTFTRPGELVKWMGAVQAQDYAAAKWALGLRLKENTDAAIDTALAEGSIVRTHVMRPTWHLVAPDDIRWLLELTAPRVKAISSYQHDKIGLDDKILLKAEKAMVKAMEGGKNLTRADLLEVFRRVKIDAGELRFVHIMMRAELDGIVSSGPKVGKQFTYGLLDERVPRAQTLSRDEARAQLALRYFTSHGPATVKDFAWWSGLTMSDAKAGLEAMKGELAEARVGDTSYWMNKELAGIGKQSTYLLPAYDEYLISYADRGAALASGHTAFVATTNGIFKPVLVINGKVAGTWKRAIHKDKLEIAIGPFEKIPAAKYAGLKAAAGRYAKFIDLPLTLL